LGLLAGTFGDGSMRIFGVPNQRLLDELMSDDGIFYSKYFFDLVLMN
jgi:hypothetical protein